MFRRLRMGPVTYEKNADNLDWAHCRSCTELPVTSHGPILPFDKARTTSFPIVVEEMSRS
jgi:hypothetical protein